MNRYRMMSDKALASADRYLERLLKREIDRVSKVDRAFSIALAEALACEAEIERRLGLAAKPRLLSLEDSRSPQQLSNEVWAELGAKYGFDWLTVSPDPRTADRGTFYAEPTIKGPVNDA